MDENSLGKHWVESVLESPYLWGVVTLVAIAYGFSPKESVPATWISLGLAILTATAAVWFHERVRAHRKRKAFAAIGLITSLVALLPLGFWFTKPKVEVHANPTDPKVSTPVNIEILGSAIGSFYGDMAPISAITLRLKVTNAGPPTTLDDFILSFTLGNGETATGQIVDKSANVTVGPADPVPGFHTGVHIERSEFVQVKFAHNPMPTGANEICFISAVFPGFTSEVVGFPGTKIQLRYRDASRKQYVSEYTIPARHLVLPSR